MSSKRLWAVGWMMLMAIAATNAATWQSSFDTAKQQSRSTGRPILINFTGSDWCPACIQLRSSILNSADFQSLADRRLVLLEVDFPRGRPMAALHMQANQLLAQRYGVTAFPTLLLVDANGVVLTQVSASGPASQFVAALDQSLTRVGAPAAPTASATAGNRKSSRPGQVQDLPLFGGAATQPPPIYTNLVVKSITGKSGRRFALINSETMAPGDSAWFNLGTERVSVTCVEIRDRSVLIKMGSDTAPRELRLAGIR